MEVKLLGKLIVVNLLHFQNAEFPIETNELPYILTVVKDARYCMIFAGITSTLEPN